MSFTIETLDHVAIRVKDLEVSRQWYEMVLGLKAYQPDAWGAYPIFMLAGESGVALFPAQQKNPTPNSTHVKIDHFAFRVSNPSFEKAKDHLEKLKINFQFQDHTYFHSLYMKDPDGHTVELTTLVVPPEQFYNL